MAEITEYCILKIAIVFQVLKYYLEKKSFVLYIAAKNLKLILNFLCHKTEVFSH